MPLFRAWLSIVVLAMASAASAVETADERALDAAARAWLHAFNELDADAMAALATKDVILMDGTMPPIAGRQATRAAWRGSLPDSGIRVTSATKNLEITGDIASRIAAFVYEGPNGQVVSRGQSLELWKRVGGEWKLHRQMSSGLLAQQPLLRRPLPTDRVLDDLSREKN